MSTSYSAVPPPGVSPPGEAAAVPPCDGPLTAAQRLAALKGRLKEARTQNHKAVVAEDKRVKLGPEGVKKERAAANFARAKEAGALQSEEEKRMNTTAEAAAEAHRRAEKKHKRSAEYAWDVFNNEAQYRNYKKQVRRAGDTGRIAKDAGKGGPSGGGESGSALVARDDDPDPLAHGSAPPVDKASVQAMVDDMHEAALRRAQWSRRRTFDEAKDVTYINKRNEVYNKKIERAFDPYTAEIKANLERGTAL